MKRREFLKYLSGAITVPILMSGADEISLTMDRKEQNNPPEERLHWTNTIFYQSEDQAIVSAVEQYAKSTGCFIIEGEQDSPDIIALPFFAAVVDRSLVGRENWEGFVQYRTEANDMNLCIIVDTNHDWPVPEFDINMAVVDPGSTESAKRVIELIRKHRWSYLNR